MIESRLNLIDSMRGRWERRIPFELVALYAYVEGYAEAKGFTDSDIWRKIRIWIESYFKSKGVIVSDKRTWIDQVGDVAPAYYCQIPIFYAALDFGRGEPLKNVQVWNPSDEWRESYVADQLRIPRYGGPMPPPKLLKLGSDDSGIWRLFFFDGKGLCYDEASRSTEQKIKSWAYHCLKVPENAWAKE
jgi:hypothetical protein